MSLRDDLRLSGAKWASAALNAYSADKPDHEFAVHHMAVAVEHVSKAYLCSIAEVLLAGERPSVDDLLLLAGRADKTNQQLSDLKTIGGAGAIARAEKLLGEPASDPISLRRLREARNGVAHLGQAMGSSQFRALMAAGIEFVNKLLSEMSQSAESFWSDHKSLADSIVEQAVTDLQLRYESKLQRARQNFEQRFGSMREPHRTQAIAALSSVPLLTRWHMVSPEDCPACGSAAMVSGRDYSEDFGVWFAPKFFGCRVCDLRLLGEELRLAGFESTLIHDDDEEYRVWDSEPSED